MNSISIAPAFRKTVGQIYSPSRKTVRSVIFNNPSAANSITVGGITIAATKSFTIDLYPGEVFDMSNKFNVKGTANDYVEIMELYV